MDFIESNGIDYVLCPAGKAKDIADDDVISERRILQLHDDGVARPAEAKSAAKME